MHTFGHPVRIDEIAALCKEWHIELVEDAAESIGSTYKGNHTGTFGKIGAKFFGLLNAAQLLGWTGIMIYDGSLCANTIINGAKEFVTKTFSMGAGEDLFDAVNQEEVFTKINFDNETYHNQSRKETAVLKKYLKEVKKEGYDVYLLEYSPSKATAKKIKKYCDKNGFKYYCAKTLKLE